jgi:hypothetical protein
MPMQYLNVKLGGHCALFQVIRGLEIVFVYGYYILAKHESRTQPSR